MVFKNLALGTVLTAPSPTTSGLSLVLNSGQGAYFPQPSTDGEFWVTAFPADQNPTPATAEILKVTGRTTDTLTIVRAQRGSSAKAISTSWIILQGIYKEDFDSMAQPKANEVPTGAINSSNTAYTTAVVFTAGTLKVFYDGAFLTNGTDFTENAAGDGFTMTVAPTTGHILIVEYFTAPIAFLGGSNVPIFNELVAGTPNGTLTDFSISQTPVASSMLVAIDGLVQSPTIDYSVNAATKTITFTEAPATGSDIRITYLTSLLGSGNADTVDGFNASSSPVANALLALDSNGKMPLAALYNDGWMPDSNSWLYVSASSFKISAVNVTAQFPKGTRIKCTNNSTTFYGTVIGAAFSSDTTITLAPNSDYALANSAISNPYYSYQSSPQGYPNTFNFSTTPTASGSAFTNAPTINKAIFSIVGNIATVKINYRYNGTSGGTANTLLTLPITPITTGASGFGIRASDNIALAVQIDTTPELTVAKYDGTTAILNSNLCDVGAIYQF